MKKHEVQHVYPKFAALTYHDDVFNLIFAAARPITDYFKASNPSSTLAALFLLKAVVPGMVANWKKEGMIPRNPMMSLIFKLANEHFDKRGVAFLECDLVKLSEAMDNRCDHILLPREKDLYKFKKNCALATNEEINISCVLATFLIYVLIREFRVEWSADFTQDLYIYNGDEYLKRLVHRSQLWAK